MSNNVKLLIKSQNLRTGVTWTKWLFLISFAIQFVGLTGEQCYDFTNLASRRTTIFNLTLTLNLTEYKIKECPYGCCGEYNETCCRRAYPTEIGTARPAVLLVLLTVLITVVFAMCCGMKKKRTGHKKHH